MLKPYDNQADIPDELKEHYSKRDDGKFHADIPNDHPAVKHNATLLSEKQTAEEKARTAEAELQSAKASGLPRGHVAVTSADAQLLDRFKSLNLKPEEITAAVEDRDRFKGEAEKMRTVEALRTFAAAEGANFDALLPLVEKDGLTPAVEEVDDKGKKVQRGFFKHKDAEGKELKTPYAEYRDKNWKVFESSLAAADPNARAAPGAKEDPKPKAPAGDAERDRAARAGQAKMYRTL